MSYGWMLTSRGMTLSGTVFLQWFDVIRYLMLAALIVESYTHTLFLAR